LVSLYIRFYPVSKASYSKKEQQRISEKSPQVKIIKISNIDSNMITGMNVGVGMEIILANVENTELGNIIGKHNIS